MQTQQCTNVMKNHCFPSCCCQQSGKIVPMTFFSPNFRLKKDNKDLEQDKRWKRVEENAPPTYVAYDWLDVKLLSVANAMKGNSWGHEYNNNTQRTHCMMMGSI